MKCRDCNTVLVSEGDDMNQFLTEDLCIECALKYRYCPDCGKFMLRIDLRGDRCRPCFKLNPTLSDYGCRIDTTTKVGDGMRHFGVELETEVTSGSSVKKQLVHIDELLGDFVIMKRDGSLRDGIEIVTRPATREKHYLMWDKFLSSPHKGLVSWSSERCGMHVHVSRLGLTEDVIAKVVCFVNSNNNKKFVYVIAGRKDNGYATFKEKTFDEAGKYNGHRHEAVNLSNEETIEFRLFKGTLKKESVFKNIEFCDAIIEFCSQESLTLNQAMSRALFIKFVRQSDKWPHLMAFIMSRWFGKPTELSEKIKWVARKNCSVKTEYDLVMEE